MTDPAVDWSPADNPHAIAVSEAQWWQRTAQLAIRRLQDPDDDRISWFSSRQIDARQLIFALRQLLNAEQLVQAALEDLGVDEAVRDALGRARLQYETSLPGLQHIRDALMHFDEWARGKGRGPPKRRVDSGVSLRQVAGDYWGFAYDPDAGTISLGPYRIRVDVVEESVARLSDAIYLAARAIDQRKALDLKFQVLEALAASGIPCNASDTPIRVILGRDCRVWLSLAREPDAGADISPAQRIIEALRSINVGVVSMTRPDDLDLAGRLTAGEALACQTNSG
ncbi:hypothetical protein [Micromonospora endolithica]|uniref:hypothetical protein n=1 Tax=Micromonospora endolithica TaxID=230091 RepID=UPI0011BFA774|nr:hypothetical protein [Micromonospora endolithica]